MIHLVDLLKKIPKAAAIVDRLGQVIAHNAKLAALAGPPQNTAAEWLTTPSSVHYNKIKKLLSATESGWRGAEITLTFKGRQVLCWCETHNFLAGGELIQFLEVLDVEQYHTLEAAYLHQLRRVLDDNLWILDDDGALLWVRADNKDYDNYKGRPSHDLIAPQSRKLWDATLRQAQSEPGRGYELQVTAAADGQARYIDLCYLSGAIWGGRFYVASRKTTPTGSRIILRLKEAWTVATDSDLAAALGTRRSAVGRANAAENVPPIWLIKTGQTTGYSVDWLLTGQGQKRRM